MKNQTKSKHKSYWNNIKIDIKGKIYNFELNERGLLKIKLPRQKVRDIYIEMQKISSNNHDYNQHSITEENNSIKMISQPISTTTSNNHENTGLNITTTLSSNFDSEQNHSQIDEHSYFTDNASLLSDEMFSDNDDFDLFFNEC